MSRKHSAELKQVNVVHTGTSCCCAEKQEVQKLEDREQRKETHVRIFGQVFAGDKKVRVTYKILLSSQLKTFKWDKTFTKC